VSRRSILAISALLLLSNSVSTLANADSTTFVEIPQNTNGRMALQLCQSPSNLTCIESIEALLPNGTSNKLKLIFFNSGNYLDSQNQVSDYGYSNWSFIDVDGSTREVGTSGLMSGENYKGEQVNFNLQPKMDFGFTNLQSKDVSSGIKFKFVFRSSWVVPVAAFLMAANSEYSDEKIATGHRYTYIGSPFVGTNYSGGTLAGLSDQASDLTKSDSEEIRLYFLIDHASSIPGGSYGDTRCSKLGYPVTSHNAYGGGTPHLVDNDTMKFEIYSPHLLSTGAVNNGFFTTYMSVAWMDCMWPGNNISKAPKVEVSVVNADGKVQVASTVFKIEKGFLVVQARGFHYSAPTIKLSVSKTPLAAEVKPSPSPSANASANPVPVTVKKVTIKCMKLKIVKNITGANPKCPAGYKKL
jgi:hypothetical protein